MTVFTTKGCCASDCLFFGCTRAASASEGRRGVELVIVQECTVSARPQGAVPRRGKQERRLRSIADWLLISPSVLFFPVLFVSRLDSGGVAGVDFVSRALALAPVCMHGPVNMNSRLLIHGP